MREDHVVAENVARVAFRYFGCRTRRATPEWHNEWLRTDALPDLVEILLSPNDRSSPTPIVVELRLRQRN